MCAYVNNAFDLLNQAQSLSAGAGKKKKKVQNKPQAAENGANGQLAAGPTGGVVEVADGVEQIERAALDARSVADKCRLWKEWSRLAGERGPRATRYKDADGTQLDFTTVLLRSRAFESSLESAFAQGLANERQEAVAQLLLTCTHMSPATAQALATSLVQLSALTQNEAMDVKAAAQHAVRSIAVSLKAGQGEGGSLADRANRLGQAIVKEQAALQRLQASSTGAAAKEQAEVARRIFRLTGEQFALLQADGQPSTGSALDQLRATISTKIKAPEPSSGKGKGKGAGGQQGGNDSKAALLASLRKEDAALAAQAEQLAGQIRTLEAQLRSLRGQQQQVEDNRAALQQRMRMAGDSSQQAGKAGGNAAQQQQQLAAVDLLASVMQQASNTDPDVQAALPMVSADFVAAGRQYLAAAKASLSEVPGRISFYKQRIAQAEGLLRLGSKDNGKMKEDAERLMADLVRGAEDLRATSNQVATEVQQRHDAIMAAAPDAATLDVLRSIDGLLADVHAAYDRVQQELAPPAPAAPAPAPAAPARAAAPAPAAPPVAAVSRPAAGPVAAAAAPVAQPAPAAAPAAAAPAAAPPAAAPQPVVKSAFDRAGDLLASLPGLSARPESAATGPARKAAPPAAAPRPASAASTAPRQWGKPVAADVGVLAVAATDLDASLPTPAEAFKIPAAPAAAVGAEGEAKPKKRNQRHA